MGKTFKSKRTRPKNDLRSDKRNRAYERKVLQDIKQGNIDADNVVFEDEDKKGQGDINI